MSNHTGVVRFNILTILAGLGVQTAIAIMVNHPNVHTVMCGSVFLTLVANFYHAKILTTESCEGPQVEPIDSAVALLEYWLNICVWLSITFMSFYIQGARPFWTWNLVLCAIDAGLVATNKRVRRASIVGLLLRAHNVWFWFDVSMIVLCALLLAINALGYVTALAGSVVLCCAIVVTTLGDYWINRKLYFGDSRTSASDIVHQWDRVAAAWDQAQGDQGDIVRQRILHPWVAEQVAAANPTRVLDIGCGNGCLVRSLAPYASALVGIDASVAMIRAARTRPSAANCEYLVCNLESDDFSRLGTFDCVTALFVLQDVFDLGAVARTIATCLKGSGRLVLILDAYHNMVNGGESRKRTWADPSVRDALGFAAQHINWFEGLYSTSYVRPSQTYVDVLSSAGFLVAKVYAGTKNFNEVESLASEPQSRFVAIVATNLARGSSIHGN
jgi:SAM-dependent methyltransferase